MKEEIRLAGSGRRSKTRYVRYKLTESLKKVGKEGSSMKSPIDTP